MTNQDYKNTKTYASYMNNIAEAVKNLDQENSSDITLELESHIYEAMASNSLSDLAEGDRLERILVKLGEPKIYVKAIIDQRELQTAIKKHQIIRIIRTSLKNIAKSNKYLVTSILYLFSLAFMAIAIMELICPDMTGLFVSESGDISMGYVSPSHVRTEVLGYWIIPIMILLSVAFYYVATLILKSIIKKNSTTRYTK